MSFQFHLGHSGEMNYNFYLDSSGACVRWTLGFGDAGLCARGWTSRFGRQGFLQAQWKPWLLDVTHSMKLLWTLSKFTLNNLHTPHRPQGVCGSQSTFLGNFPSLYLQELVSDHCSWDPTLVQVVPHTPEEVAPQIPRSSFTAAPKARWELKASDCLADVILCAQCSHV